MKKRWNAIPRLRRGKCTKQESAGGAPRCGWRRLGPALALLCCAAAFLTVLAAGSFRGWRQEEIGRASCRERGESAVAACAFIKTHGTKSRGMDVQRYS